MFRFINILCLTLVFGVGIFAQNQTDEYKKNEYYVGYSNQQVEFGSRRTYHGFEGAYVRNIHRYLGLKADVSGAYRNNDFTVTGLGPTDNVYTFRAKSSNSVYNFLGGVQFKDNRSKARLKPFGHVLAGAAVNRFRSSNFTCTVGTCPDYILNAPAATFYNTNFSMAAGGGLDIKINDKVDFRAIQVDYNPVFGSGSRQDNVRFGIGFVFK